MLPANPASRVCTSRSIRPSCWTAAVTSAAAPTDPITNWAANTARGSVLDQAGQRSSGPAVQGPAGTPRRRRRDDRAHHRGAADRRERVPEQQSRGHQGRQIGDGHHHSDTQHGRAAARRKRPSRETSTSNDQEPDHQHETPRDQRQRETADLTAATVRQQPQLGSDTERFTEGSRFGGDPADDRQTGDQDPAGQGCDHGAPGRGQQPAPARQLGDRTPAGRSSVGSVACSDNRGDNWGTGARTIATGFGGVRAGKPWPVHARRGRSAHRADTPEAGKVITRLCLSAPPEGIPEQ